MPSVMERLHQRPALDILSIGSGTGQMDMEILGIIKDELQRSQGRHQIKIFNRAVEPNEYPCDVYTAVVKRLNDPQLDFDIRCQTFDEYREQGVEESEERWKFDVVHFIHSIYYVDTEEALCHCIENELRPNGSLFCIVEGTGLSYSAIKKQRLSDFPEIVEVAEKISKIAMKRGWKHEVYNQEYSFDVTDVFDEESEEGNLLLDFLTHSTNFRGSRDQQIVKETLALIKDLSTIKDGRRFGKKKDSLIVIYK